MENENTILYHLTEEQAELLCKAFNKNLKDLEEYEVCDLLDRYIDKLVESED